MKKTLLIIFGVLTLTIIGIWVPTFFNKGTESKSKKISDSIQHVNYVKDSIEAVELTKGLAADSISIAIDNKVKKVKKITVPQEKESVTIVIEDTEKTSWREGISWGLGSINSLILIFLGYRKIAKKKESDEN
jgi:uncharacterized membrane protein YraQ (UPF0718 family)